MGKQSIPTTGLSPASPTALWAASIAEIFVASHALNRLGESAYDDLKSDMDSQQHEEYRKRVQANWPDLASAKDKAKAREFLIDLCDYQIEELNEKLNEHAADADENVEKTFNRLGVGSTREAERLGAYLLKCRSAFYRGVGKVQRHQGKTQRDGQSRGYPHEPRLCEPAASPRMGRRKAASYDVPVADEDLDLSWAYEPYPGDHAADGAAGPRDIQPTAVEQELHVAVAVAVAPQNPPVMTAAVAVAEPGDEISPPSENTQNATIEANFDENAAVAKLQESVDVMANPGLNPGLDKRANEAKERGRSPGLERRDLNVETNEMDARSGRPSLKPKEVVTEPVSVDESAMDLGPYAANEQMLPHLPHSP